MRLSWALPGASRALPPRRKALQDESEKATTALKDGRKRRPASSALKGAHTHTPDLGTLAGWGEHEADDWNAPESGAHGVSGLGPQKLCRIQARVLVHTRVSLLPPLILRSFRLGVHAPRRSKVAASLDECAVRCRKLLALSAPL